MPVGREGALMDHWSDEQIRQALLEHDLCKGVPITSSTRPSLIRKLQSALNTTPSPAAENDDTNDSSKTTSSQSTDEEAGSYYGVSAVLTTSHEEFAGPVLSPFYTSKLEALKAIKGIPGARFKKFESRVEAESFSQKDVLEHTINEADSGPISSLPVKSIEKANNLPSLKTQDLSKFRGMIERGDVESFLEYVQMNPRYLITAGDAPQILKPPMRYNSLHCAVIAGQLEICRLLLWTLQEDNFWGVVYPDDDSDTVRPSRKRHLLDLYLNMQDKGCGETPLHFACKLGQAEIVALLLSIPLTSTTVKNKYGEMPAQIICQKAKNSSPELKARIEALLREPEIFYVPVLRTEGNSTPPQLSHPVTLQQLDDIESQAHGCELPKLSSGLAGPMSPKEAKHFYQEWRSPGHGSSERKELVRIKRTDSDRGMERIGRQLAHKNNVGWFEYWDFLDVTCDLSNPEGLDLLEDHLRSKCNNSSHLMDKESPIPFQHSGFESSSDVSRKLFDEDEIDPAVLNNSQFSDTNKLADLFSKNVSLAPKDDNTFISGSAPTKLDYDVYLALCNVSPDPSEYPCIVRWLGLLDQFSEEEKKTWRTPRKQPPPNVTNTPTSTPHPVSPLVYSSPSIQNYSSSSPLVSSSTSLNRSMNSNTTPNVQYWTRQSTTPQRRTPHSLNGSVRTTPRRQAQARIITPTRYGKLSFTPKGLKGL